MTRRAALLPLLLFSLAACGGHPESTSSQTAQAPAPAATEAAPPAAPAPDSGVGPVSSSGTTVPGPAAATSTPPSGPAAGNVGLAFDLPKAWTSETPKSNMRLAQATIPGPSGTGELAIFYFGAGQGGAVNANIERWIDQMEMAAGAPKPERGTLESHGLKVSWVDVHGTLKPSSMGMGPSNPVPDARLFGAVVEGTGGPWFIKATGPDSTLAPQRDAFFSLLKSVRPAANT
jgi:hypothetical protein